MTSRFYLIRLFHANKTLFVVVLLFVILNLIANFVYKTEQTPLFMWDLYSRQIHEQKIYSFLEVRYNDDEVLSFPHTWDEPQKLFFNTIDYFIAMKRNNDNDPFKSYIDTWNKNHPLCKKILPGLKFYNDTTELKEFPAWYKRYLQQYVKKPVYKIYVYEVKVVYLDSGEVEKLSSTLIYKLL